MATYLIEGNGAKRMVTAKSGPQAMAHVTGSMFTYRALSADEVADLIDAGVKREKAEGPQPTEPPADPAPPPEDPANSEPPGADPAPLQSPPEIFQENSDPSQPVGLVGNGPHMECHSPAPDEPGYREPLAEPPTDPAPEAQGQGRGKKSRKLADIPESEVPH